jgi:sugar/nucleoside kinase (ribokinase family)
MRRRTVVFGPAYLDRVLLVDRPLVDPEHDASLDQSIEGVWTFGPGLKLVDDEGSSIKIELPADWPGPTGGVGLRGLLGASPGGWCRLVRGVAWHDDLGGMGAGFAAALGGTLVSALGAVDDPMSRCISNCLENEGVVHHAIRVEDRPADWTLLLTSGPFGDKLAVGFRGCHAAVETLRGDCEQPCDLRVVASLPNRLAEEALSAAGAGVRVFTPGMRNMTDRDAPLGRFARHVDILCCNRREWEALDDREQVAWQVSLLAVTDGPRGGVLRFTTPRGEAGRLAVPAFPRSHPPRDTNRAGEAYAASLVSTLLDHGWSPGVNDPDLIRDAAHRASAAAALVLDRTAFGFPTCDEIDAALRAGYVGAPVETGGDSGPARYNEPDAGPGTGREKTG